MSRAIVTFARSWQSLAITRSLGRAGVEVYCGEEGPFAPCFFSRYCKGSFVHPSVSSDPAGFLECLIEQTEKLKPEDGSPLVLIPVHKETWLIAQHRDRFGPHVRLALTSHENMAQVHDKGRLAELAMEQGLLIPDTQLLHSLDALYAAAPGLKYPVFVKLREGAAGIGVKKADTPEELTTTFRAFVDGYGLEPAQYPLVQGFVAGSDYCVTLLFDQGRCVAKMTYRNIRAFPRETGAGSLRETVRLPEAEAVAERLLAGFNWHGIAEVDFRQEEGGPSYLIEVNPRFFGGLPQALAANVDYPHLLYRVALGEEQISAGEVDYETRTETPLTGLLATLDEIAHDDALLAKLRGLRGEWGNFLHSDLRELNPGPLFKAMKQAASPRDAKSFLTEMFSKHQGTINDVLQADDPMPAMGLLYPAALMLKHGKLNMSLLTGEAALEETRPRRRLRDYLMHPTWGALALCFSLYVLSIFLQHWGPGASNLGWLLAWPGRLADRLFGAIAEPHSLGAAFKVALHHALNLGLLYLGAALLLRESRTKAQLEKTESNADEGEGDGTTQGPS